jgi:predicted ATPase
MAAVHLRALEARPDRTGASRAFPFSVPAIRSLETLDLNHAVTFFVGENGSGKSTLLEGIAVGAALPTVGHAEVNRDETLGPQRQLADSFKLVWNQRVRRGFYLRAEDFFGFSRRMAQLRAELTGRLRETDQEYANASAFTRGLAQGPLYGSLAEMRRLYGDDLDARSHGESFLKLFEARFAPGGLYLMDEPEAALSPQNQLGLLALMKAMVEQDAQFIIATHSPIVLAFPNARIYSFDTTPIAEVAYNELDHVTLTRDFLNRPDRFLRQL